MRPALILLLMTALAACGADGEPVTPTRDATITISNSGLSGIGRIGLNRGPVSVTLGLGL